MEALEALNFMPVGHYSPKDLIAISKINTAILTSSKQEVNNESKLPLFQLRENDKWNRNAIKWKGGSLLKVICCSDYNSPVHTSSDYSPTMHTLADPMQSETKRLPRSKTIFLQQSPRRRCLF